MKKLLPIGFLCALFAVTLVNCHKQSSQSNELDLPAENTRAAGDRTDEELSPPDYSELIPESSGGTCCTAQYCGHTSFAATLCGYPNLLAPGFVIHRIFTPENIPNPYLVRYRLIIEKLPPPAKPGSISAGPKVVYDETRAQFVSSCEERLIGFAFTPDCSAKYRLTFQMRYYPGGTGEPVVCSTVTDNVLMCTSTE